MDAKMPPEGSLLRVASNYLCLFFHDFQHHSGTQLKSVLEYEAICNDLIFSHTVGVFLKQFFLFVRHGGFELFFVPEDLSGAGFFANKSVISNSIRIAQVCCTSHRCGNSVSVKTISLKSIGLFCPKNVLRILPYSPRDCVSVCANLMSGT